MGDTISGRCSHLREVSADIPSTGTVRDDGVYGVVGFGIGRNRGASGVGKRDKSPGVQTYDGEGAADIGRTSYVEDC